MKSTASFERRLNKDSDLRKLERGQYRSAKNARVGTSQESNVGTLESTASNLLFTGSYSFPSGTNKCIGACADIKNNAIIYCWFNSNNNHRIFRWDADTGVITNILSTSWNVAALGWTASTRLWNMRIVESGTDQLMFFHAVQGVPMRINLGIITQRGAGAYTLTIDDISVARKPPVAPPSLTFQNINNNINFVNDNNFQFRYRYIYENGEKSTFGPWSELSVPDGNNYESIAVSFNSGVKGVLKVELSFRIGNGVSSTGSQNTLEYIWRVWTKGSNTDNTEYTENFYYNESLIPVSLNQSAKLFDSVPQLVGCQEIVQSNQIIYGDITEGYDNPIVDAIFEATYKSTKIIKFTNSANSFDLSKYTDEPPSIGVLHMIVFKGSVYVHYYYQLSSSDLDSYPDNMGNRIVDILANTGSIYTYNASTNILSKTSGNTLTELTLIPTYQIELTKSSRYNSTASTVTTDSYSTPYTDAGYKVRILVNLKMASSNTTLAINVNKNGVLYATKNILATTTYQLFDVSFLVRASAGDDINITITGGTLLNAIQVESLTFYCLGGIANITKSGFKLGSNADFGIVYYDDYLRNCGVISKGNVSFDFDLDNPNTWQFENDNPTKGFIGQALITITSRPPIWAKYYQIVTSGSKVLNFEQFVGNVASVSSKTEITFDSLGSYDIAIGDIIRIVAVSAFDTTNGQRSQYLYSDPIISAVNSSQFDKPVMRFHRVEAFDLTINKITTDIGFYDDATQFGAVLTNQRLIIEVMKPKPSASEFFFEFGCLYSIGNPGANNRYHMANIQNQDATNPSSTPAIIETNSGPIWFRFSNRINVTQGASNLQIDKFFYLLSNSSTDDRESNYWDQGRPQVETPDQKQVRYNSGYRWGNQLIQNTQVNGMSTFDSGNIGILSAKFGALTAMREIGYTLKMIQESNYNTAFIGRKQLSNADGSTNLVVTDSLIGTVNPSEDLYGSKYPGSVVINGRNLYWLDTIKGKIIRESGNQPFPISDYGMVKYWRDASLQIDGLGYEVFAGFDKQTEQLFITYKRTGADVFTLSFYDPERDGIEKGWVCDEHSFTKVISSVITPVDMYAWVGQVFTSALGAGAYKHNVGNTYLQLYGEQKTMSVSSPFILNPEQMTVFLAHWVRANRDFLGTIFTIPAGPQTPNGMRTLLVSGNYSIKENAFYSEIKRDGLTKGLVSDDSNSFKIQMLEGRVMRGYVCLAEISYSGSLSFVIFSHSIADEYSPLS